MKKQTLAFLLLILGLSGLLISAGMSSGVSDRPILQFHLDEAIGVVRLRLLGLNPELIKLLNKNSPSIETWREVFAVYTGETLPPVNDARPAVLGRYVVDSGSIEFLPRFPFAPGMNYTAKFDFDTLARAGYEVDTRRALTTTFAIPQQEVIPTTKVENVYPTSNRLPINQLKIYIHFSAPMRPGRAYEHIRLYDETTGEEVEDAFLVLDKELWDPDRQRLTVLFDPGRIKRGLSPNELLGLPLVEEHRYQLLIKQDWSDARGTPLVSDFSKVFIAGPADRVSPDIGKWQIFPPEVGTLEPLVLDFAEPLDHGLLHRVLVVLDTRQQEVPGQITVSRSETRWTFVPAQPWAAGRYHLQVDSWLEDLAGNNLRRLFDVDLSDPNYRVKNDDFLTLDFTVAGKQSAEMR